VCERISILTGPVQSFAAQRRTWPNNARGTGAIGLQPSHKFREFFIGQSSAALEIMFAREHPCSTLGEHGRYITTKWAVLIVRRYPMRRRTQADI